MRLEFHIGDACRKMREKSGQTIQELSEVTGIPAGTITKLEKTGNGQISDLDTLMCSLGCNFSDFQNATFVLTTDALSERRRKSKMH